MAQVSWTPQAADDLEAICLFIARDTPQIAATFADRVVTATDRLESHPRMGRVVPELGLEDLRPIDKEKGHPLGDPFLFPLELPLFGGTPF